jgi:L-threonylcarbamoyladenylate synthase
VLDGGPCEVGIESTVLDLSGQRARILRPGGISKAQIEAVLGGDVEAGQVVSALAAPAVSPGQQAVHYAPQTPAYRYEREQAGRVPRLRVGVMALSPADVLGEGPVVAMPAEPDAYARRLYAALRELDALQLEGIYIEMPPDEPEWAAVRDRIRRATRALPDVQQQER